MPAQGRSHKVPYDPKRDIPDGAPGDDRWPGGNNGESQVVTRGRPSFWDGAIGEKRRQEAVLCIGDGLNLEMTSDILGCTYECLYHQMRYNVEFTKALKRASAVFTRRALERITKGEDKWQAAAWLLERRRETRAMFAPPAVQVLQPTDNDRVIRVRNIERSVAPAPDSPATTATPTSATADH